MNNKAYSQSGFYRAERRLYKARVKYLRYYIPAMDGAHMFRPHSSRRSLAHSVDSVLKHRKDPRTRSIACAALGAPPPGTPRLLAHPPPNKALLYIRRVAVGESETVVFIRFISVTLPSPLPNPIPSLIDIHADMHRAQGPHPSGSSPPQGPWDRRASLAERGGRLAPRTTTAVAAIHIAAAAVSHA